jgi:allantoate deiminase
MSRTKPFTSLTGLAGYTEEMIEWLALYGADPEGGVTRLLYTPSWVEAQRALERKMKETGLDVFYDDAGNLFGRLETGSPGAGTIVTGSHIDTVKCGGKYDGAYGIIAGFIALQYLKDNYGSPQRNLEVISLCEEEGSRFPLTYWGSTYVTGMASYQQIENIKDAQGISFKEAMRAAGFGAGSHGVRRRDDIQAFIELHIEQGAILEFEEKSIGIVEQIVGQKRYTVEVSGEANHAGTTLMAWRKDALQTAVQMIHYLMESAGQAGAPLVATVGRLSVEPNIPNVIPDKVAFSVDVRHPSGQVLHQFSEQFLNKFKNMAAEREVGLSIENWMDENPVNMDIVLNEQVEKICRKQGVAYKYMASGAGHDSQIFASLCPTALLFVPSHRGISHSPLEYTSAKDLETGIKVLIELLYNLGYEKEIG